MTEKLDQYRAAPEELQGIKRQLHNAGIPDEVIPLDWLEYIVAATNKWHSTREGSTYLLRNLRFKMERGRDDKDYEYVDEKGNNYEIPSEHVITVQGILLHGNPIHPDCVTITTSHKDQCEGCGIKSHCVDDVRNPATDKIETLCNTCRSMHNNPKIADTACKKTCDDCTVITCFHHPRRRYE